MKKELFRFTLYVIIVYLTNGTLSPAIAATQPSEGNRIHFCGVDGQWNKQYSDQFASRHYARTSAANLNVGEPRTLRMIYFLPNDRPYRASVVQKMKDMIRTVQTSYAEQMEAHGYGKITFRFETDSQGEPMVHRVDGHYPDSHYLDTTVDDIVLDQINLAFNLDANVYLIVINYSKSLIGNSSGGVGIRWGKNGGFALVTQGFNFEGLAHELGHAFGLNHDFRDGAYIMSYNPGHDRLSASHAEYLSVHPYFNLNIPTEEGEPPTIELISPRLYPAGSQSVPVRLKVNDSDGLHQLLLYVTSIEPHSAAGFYEVKASWGLGGDRDTTVRFDYDGVIPSDSLTSLSDPAIHPISVRAVDTDGDVGYTSFGLTEISPHHITTLDEHRDKVHLFKQYTNDTVTPRFNVDGHGVHSVAFSPVDATLLATGSWDGTVKLWDVVTERNIATLKEHTAGITSVAFSSDGSTLATGSWDRTVKLWDVETERNIATLKEHTAGITSVAFSSDGSTLATGSWDRTVRLWDVETERNIATLKEHTDVVTSVAFSSDGSTLATGSWDRTVRLWDVETERNIATLKEHTDVVTSVAFSSDGSTLATGSWDRTVKLWDVATRQNIATLKGHTGPVNSVAFSSDGSTLATTGLWDRTVKLWNIATLVNFVTLGHGNPVRSVAFSSDDTTLASGTEAGTVELWDTSMLMGVRLEATAEIDIPDPNLRAAIAEAIGLPPNTPILRGHLQALTDLEARNANISNLTGLEGATSLRTLDLRGNSVSDFSPLTDLTNLRSLFLVDNNISDISTMSGLNSLARLNLGNNNISDISAVAGLTNLASLNLQNNNISDISALAGLTNLTLLYLSGNNISDISAVSGLTDLPVLDLWYNNISDILAVSGLTKLRWLNLGGNSVSDISAVSGLTNLTGLNLVNNNVSDISVVVRLTQLTWLNLSNNAISDVSPLLGLNLTGIWWDRTAGLYLEGNPLSYPSINTHIPAMQAKWVEVKFDNRAHPALLKISGDNQKGAAFAPLSQPFLVEAQDENGFALVGISVMFAVTRGDGTLGVTSTTTDANGRAQSTLILGPNLGANTVEVSAAGIQGTAIFHAISGTLPTEYRLSIPAGISLIHVPLKVTAVDGMEQTIESVGDLYDVLGGTGTVNFLITYDSQTQEWRSYFVSSDRGTLADAPLADDTGIIAGLRAPMSVHLSGDPLGTDGNSTITLNQGLNLVGLPLRDPRKMRVSDLFALEGIGGNVPVIILTDGGEFKLVGRAGDPGDVPVTGEQSFIMTAQRAATVAISGEGWYNVSEVAAGPPLMAQMGIEVGDTTPVLALRGSITSPVDGWGKMPHLRSGSGFRVIVKNLSTGRAVAAVTKDENLSRTDRGESMGGGYQGTIVDVETGRAARIGDILEVSVRSPDPLIGVQPLRYTVTAEDVKRGLIQLTELVAYKIPTETELLPNYPNPFNPETWIPYRLAEDAFVTLTIYDGAGQVVRTLDVGHQIAAVYENRSKAIYWDGRNGLGEQVASGVYFYHLSAGDYSATRKMVILK